MPDIQTQVPIESKPTFPRQNFFHRHSRSIWLSLVSIALAVVVLLGYILFFRKSEPPPTYQNKVSLAIAAPEETVSGSEISYELTIENQSSGKLTRMSLEMFYPQGFTFIRSDDMTETDLSTSLETGRRLDLPDLPRGESLKLAILGRLEGNVQEIKTVSAKLHYVPENFNSFFTADAQARVVILAPDISIRTLGPSSIISGQVIEYHVDISSVSGEEFHNLLLEISYPPGFVFQDASPQPTKANNEWVIDLLGAGSSEVMIITGRMLDKPGENVFLTAELFTQANGDKLSAGRSYAFTRLLDSPLLLSQTLLGGFGTVFGGETLEYEINYENIGEIGLSNVTIVMKFDTLVFDFTKTKIQPGQIRGSEIVWLPAAVPELRTVKVGQRGKFVVEIPLRPESALTQKNPLAQTRVQFTADEILEPISSEPLTLKLGTNMTIETKVSLLSGPKEPEIGETSEYLVILTVKNTVNDLENAELTARLPGTFVVLNEDTLEPEEEIANFEFQHTGGILRWKLGKIFAYSGTIHSPRTISFLMSVTPEQRISGGPVLLEELMAQGHDAFTNEQVLSNVIETVKAR